MGTLILPTGNNKKIDIFGLFTNYINMDTVIFIYLTKQLCRLSKTFKSFTCP